jgi:hypothetical protein
MTIAKLSERLLSAALPTVDADASCGRCELHALTQCCRRNYRRFALIDVCGNVCDYRCHYRPAYC